MNCIAWCTEHFGGDAHVVGKDRIQEVEPRNNMRDLEQPLQPVEIPRRDRVQRRRAGVGMVLQRRGIDRGN